LLTDRIVAAHINFTKWLMLTDGKGVGWQCIPFERVEDAELPLERIADLDLSEFPGKQISVSRLT
jgi:hypothetical protein